MNLSTEWTEGMSPEQKEAFLRILTNNTVLVRRVNELIEKWELSIDRGELSLTDYDKPNWANRQAFRNGDRSRIKKLKDLFRI